MKRIEQTFEKQYKPIEPGWNFAKEELVKNIQVPDKGYSPIEPDSGLLKPYHRILKNALEADSFLKLIGFYSLIPGSTIYSYDRTNDIKREIAQEKEKEFIPIKFNKSDKLVVLMTEGLKIFCAFECSSVLAKWIW